MQGCFVLRRGKPAPEPKKTPAELRADSIEKADAAIGIKPYSKVISRTAQTRAGLFRTHRAGDTLFFEIPRNELRQIVHDMEKQMKEAAKNLEFEKAAALRDELYQLKSLLADDESLKPWERIKLLSGEE